MEYNRSSHYVYSCKYHIIFCPKYRSKVLKEDIEIRFKEIMKQLEIEDDFHIVEMEVMPDHIHLLLDCRPDKSPVEIVKHIKWQSAHILRKEFPELKTRLPNLWTRSAFIASVGSISLETVKEYIKNQKGK